MAFGPRPAVASGILLAPTDSPREPWKSLMALSLLHHACSFAIRNPTAPVPPLRLALNNFSFAILGKSQTIKWNASDNKVMFSMHLRSPRAMIDFSALGELADLERRRLEPI